MANSFAMELPNLPLPGYQVKEYMLVLSPHEDLRNKIAKIKDEFAEKWKAPAVRLIKPHINLLRFSQRAMMEDRIIQRMQTIGMGMAPFKVELKDFGSFPSHSITINVPTRIPVQVLTKQLKESARLFRMNNESKPHFVDDPYILIASKLKPWQYEQSWASYSHRQFTGRFIADSMLLLSRPEGSREGFQISARLEFQNLPVSTRQGDLFF